MRGIKRIFQALFLLAGLSYAQTDSLTLTVPSPAKDLKLSFSFGMPDLFSLSATKNISPTYQMGFSFGYLPVGLLFPQKISQPTGSLQEGYTMEVLPRSHLLSSGIYLRHFPMGNSLFLQAQLGVFVGSVGGEGVLRNDSSQKTIPVASLDVQVFQPTLAASVGTALFSWKESVLEANLGILFLLPATLNTAISGNGPAFLEVVPEWRERIIESFPQAEAEITQTLRQTWLTQRLLPSLSLRYNF